MTDAIPQTRDSARPDVLRNLHLLRAIAALAVVNYHISSEAGLNLPVSIGHHGVDVFFVISGFIIAYIGVRAPEHFLLRRLIRIVPFYWAATCLVFAISAAMPNLFRSTQPDVIQLLCSLLFIPRETSYAGMFPTLILGWSLNYEMYFYLVFAAALAFTGRRAPAVCCAGITLIYLLITVSGVQNASVQFYARPLVFEFVFGIGVFYLLRHAAIRKDWFERNAWMRQTLWMGAIGGIVAIGIEEYFQGFGLPRVICAGIPAALLVLSALLLETMYGFRLRSKAIFIVGESSYILYLIHPYIVYGLLRTVLRAHTVNSVTGTVVVIVALLFVSTLISVAIHLWFERPLMALLRRRLLPQHTSGEDSRQAMIRPAAE